MRSTSCGTGDVHNQCTKKTLSFSICRNNVWTCHIHNLFGSPLLQSLLWTQPHHLAALFQKHLYTQSTHSAFPGMSPRTPKGVLCSTVLWWNPRPRPRSILKSLDANQRNVWDTTPSMNCSGVRATNWMRSTMRFDPQQALE